ncbi:MAG: ester cyclase [Anaerolineae bacterium]
MSVDNHAIGRRFMEDFIGNARWDEASDILAQDVVMHHPSSPQPIAGIEAVTGLLMGFRAGFPDMNMQAEDVAADGDKVVVRWRVRGTHTADLFGIPPTGKIMDVMGISWLRIADGKIAEDWVSEDTVGWMRQLGLLPAMG